MKFRIDKSKWRCGGDGKFQCGEGETRLYNEQGYMCCLGQTCNSLGVRKRDMDDVCEPEGVECLTEKTVNNLKKAFLKDSYKTYLDYENSNLSELAMNINDDESINNTERQKKLKKLFKEHGHEIEFFGKLVKPKRKMEQPV